MLKQTIFAKGRLPLTKWFIAIYLETTLKKGTFSCQLAKYIEIQTKDRLVYVSVHL